MTTELTPEETIVTHSNCDRCRGRIVVTSSMTEEMIADELGCDTGCGHAYHAYEGDPVRCLDCGATATIDADNESCWVVWPDRAR